MMKSVVSYPFFRTNLLFLVFGMAVVLFIGMARPAMAVPITFIAQGTVNSVGAPLSGTFSVGDTFRIEYTFESSTPDLEPRADQGIYFDAITDLTVMVGTYSATADGRNIITVIDGLSADTYRIDLTDPMLGPSVNGYDLSTQSPLMLLGDSTGMAFTSDALPTSLSDIGGLTGGGFTLEFIDSLAPPNQHILAFVTANNISITPEPGSVSLLVLGAVALLRRRR